MNFLNKVRNYKVKIPDIKRILFEYIPNDNSHIRDFMNHCFPNSLELFTFGWGGDRINIDYYSSALKQALSKVTREVLIQNKVLSKECFETVVKSSARCERLILRYCVTDTDSECDFSGSDYNINYFGLAFTGRHDASGWKNNPKRFENIVIGIKGCGLKDTIKNINVYE
jgi:hypothetical protein